MWERMEKHRENAKPLQMATSHALPLLLLNAPYLQDENEVVDGFAPLVDVVMGRALVAFVELDLLDHVGVAQDSQQHLV